MKNQKSKQPKNLSKHELAKALFVELSEEQTKSIVGGMRAVVREGQFPWQG